MPLINKDDWLKGFYDRLMTSKDPTAMFYKAKTEELQKAEEQKRRFEEERKLKLLEQSKLQKQAPVENDSFVHRLDDLDDLDDLDVEIERVQLKQTQYQAPKRKSFWQKIKDFFFEK